MPLVGIIIGGHELSNLVIKFKDTQINYGFFLQNVVDFLIVAFCIFVFIKAINKFKRKKPEIPSLPKKSEEVILLEEIRDLLKNEVKAKNTKKSKSVKKS